MLYLAGIASATIANSRLQGLSAMVSGGAAYIKDNSSLVVSNSCIRRNVAPMAAGFLCSHGSKLNITHSLLEHNNAARKGGGIVAYRNCTVRTRPGACGLNSESRQVLHNELP